MRGDLRGDHCAVNIGPRSGCAGSRKLRSRRFLPPRHRRAGIDECFGRDRWRGFDGGRRRHARLAPRTGIEQGLAPDRRSIATMASSSRSRRPPYSAFPRGGSAQISHRVRNRRSRLLAEREHAAATRTTSMIRSACFQTSDCRPADANGAPPISPSLTLVIADQEVTLRIWPSATNRRSSLRIGKTAPAHDRRRPRQSVRVRQASRSPCPPSRPEDGASAERPAEASSFWFPKRWGGPSPQKKPSFLAL